MKIALLVALAALTLMQQIPTAPPEDGGFDAELAATYFDELKKLLDADKGGLWGMHLHGRLMFVDPDSRLIVANRQNGENTFERKGKVYTGRLGKEVSIANTAMELFGEKWVMVNWSYASSTDPVARNRLLIHESWHAVQEKLGFPFATGDNQHLDELEGRIHLRLEWRALRRALLSNGRVRMEAIQDALVFRLHRQNLFEGAHAHECAFEMHEGLAEYTGMKLAGYRPEMLPRVLDKKLRDAENEKSHNWSFAYSSGPAYGLLLDEAGIDWRRDLKADGDFAGLLQAAYSIDLPADTEGAAKSRYSVYGGEELIRDEREREEVHRERMRNFTAAFVESPALEINLIQMNISFDPNQIFPLGERGSVYQKARISDVWGILEADKGLLLSNDWKRITVSKPSRFDAAGAVGDGWTLSLTDGWEVFEETDGSFSLRKKR